MITNDTADAVAGAAIRLYHRELKDAVRAIQYETNVELWIDGPEPTLDSRSSNTKDEEQ
jgi:hypothetical protein